MSHIETPVQPDTDTHTPGASTVALTTLASAVLAACGGGSDTATENASTTPGIDPSGLVATTPLSDQQAWRFLDQATMGPKASDITYVKRNGYDAWLNAQFSLPKTSFLAAYTEMWEGALAETRRKNPGYSEDLVQERTGTWVEHVRSTWWKSAIEGKDQLRQRVAFALSEIVVTSFTNQQIGERPKLMAGWADLLHKHAFGNYRSFIYDVVRSPAMGIYLSHIQNIQPNAAGQRPDQNFARELIQLFTTGLVELDDSGRVQMEDGVAKPASMTAATDVKVLSHVFVGLAFDGNFRGTPYGYRDFPNFHLDKSGDAWVNPMKLYQTEACTQEMVTTSLGLPSGAQLKLLDKDFAFVANDLNATINAALDIIFQHKNLAPFVAKQMIQRLVTSNPTAGQVYRAAQAFRNSKYDMKALVRAILLDKDALTAPAATATAYGKIREPILRVTHLLRAFNAKNEFGNSSTYQGDTALPYVGWRPALALGQAPLSAVNVFNFFSPTYVANKSATADINKVAPELQITTETTVASYVNAIQDILENGMFLDIPLVLDLTEEIPLAGATASPTTSAAIVNAVKRKLMGDTMSDGLKNHIIGILNGTGSLEAKYRVRLAILLAMVSPEYIVQK
jgi:uncharacterized protein (DUF1800 family)